MAKHVATFVPLLFSTVFGCQFSPTLPATGPDGMESGECESGVSDPLCTGYSNDFGVDTGDFDYGSEGWSMSGDVLSSPSCADDEAAYLNGGSWADVVVHARARVTEGCSLGPSAGVMIRASGAPACPESSGYVCVMSVFPRLVGIFRVDTGGCDSALETTFAEMRTGEWYDFEFRAEGTTLTCTVSGGGLSEPVMVTATDESVAEGTVGVLANHSAAEFDDLVVTTP